MLVRKRVDTETLMHCWWECNMVQVLWKAARRFLKKIKNKISMQSSNSSAGYISKIKQSLQEICVHLCSNQQDHNSYKWEATQASTVR